MSSPIKSWLSFDKGKHFFSKDLFYQMDTVVNCIYDLNKLGRLHIINLERLHRQNTLLMKKLFVKNLKLNMKNHLKINKK